MALLIGSPWSAAAFAVLSLSAVLTAAGCASQPAHARIAPEIRSIGVFDKVMASSVWVAKDGDISTFTRIAQDRERTALDSARRLCHLRSG